MLRSSLACALACLLIPLLSLQGEASAERAAFSPALFDVRAAREQGDLSVQEIGPARVRLGVTLTDVTFLSTEWNARGVSRRIRIRGVLGVPGKAGPHAAVLVAHGLGWHADADQVVEIVRNLGVVGLAISAPGVEGSEGIAATPQDTRALFTASPDVRGSWIYNYSYALLRALTLLETRKDVDRSRLVMTGSSMGGIATFIVNGIDDRVSGALPVIASGDLAGAIRAGSWLRRLVRSAGGVSPSDPGPRAVMRRLDPLAYAGTQHGAVYLLAGVQDEFFPLSQIVTTYRALVAPEKRLVLLPDYDHDWYFGSGCPARCMPGAARDASCPGSPVCPERCPRGAVSPYCGPEHSYNQRDTFIVRWVALLRSLVIRGGKGPQPPQTPEIERTASEIIVRVADGAKKVRLALSEDAAYTFAQIELTRGPDGHYRLVRTFSPRAIVFAEVEGEGGVVATSVPVIPKGFRQRLRPFRPRSE